MRYTLIVGALLVATHAAEAGSPWLRDDGEGYLQLTAYRIGAYDTLFQSSGGNFVTGRAIEDVTIEAYAEFGLTEDWTLICVVPWKNLETGAESANATIRPVTIAPGSRSVLGNVVLGARRRLPVERIPFAAQLDIGFPTGDFDRPTGISSGYDAVTLSATLGAGKSFRRFYVSGYAGLGLRTNDFSNDWRAGAEGGLRLFGRLWIVGLVDVVQSFEDGDVALDPNNIQTGLYVNDQEVVATGIKGLLDISRNFGIQVTRFSATSGNQVAKDPLTGFGAYFTW